MLVKLKLVIIFSIWLFEMYGQMPFYLKHNSFDYAINPAITGRDYYPVLNISHKKYWFGIKDSPSATSIGGNLRMGTYNFYTPKRMLNKSSVLSKSRMGVGGFLMKEQDGPQGYLHATINYAYHIPLNKDKDQLSFGLSAQLYQYTINKNILDPLDADDEKIFNLENHPLVPQAGFGVYFHNYQFDIGLAVNDLFASKLDNIINGIEKNTSDYFAHTGYRFFLKNIELEPSVFGGLINQKQYCSGRLKMYFMQYHWTSISFNSFNSINYSLGLRLNRFQLVYSFEHATSKMVTVYNGSHEIMFGLNIGLYEAEGLRKLVK